MNTLLRANAPVYVFPHHCHRSGPVCGVETAEMQLAAAEGWLLLGDADEAEREMAKLSYRDRHQPAALRLGVQVALALKLPKEALDLAAKLTAQKPRDLESWKLLVSVALDGCGRTDWALRILREASMHLPENPEINEALELIVELAGPGL